MPDKRPTVADAVTSFMVVFGSSPDIHSRAESFIATLNHNPQWSSDEVQEVKRLIEDRIGSPTR